MKTCYGLIVLLILWSVTETGAATYKWTDDHGVASFTDDPALIPSRYRSKALIVKDAPIRNPKVKQAPGKQKVRKRENQPVTPRSATSPDIDHSTPAQPGMRQTIKGHLGGDQTDPAPPSMKQPIPAPLGDQPKATPLGMKQPIPAAPGVQPKASDPGMKQPVPEPIGVQPTATPLGMEQPTPKQ